MSKGISNRTWWRCLCMCAPPCIYNVGYRQGERMNGGKVRGVSQWRSSRRPSPFPFPTREKITLTKKSSVYVCVCRAYSINHERGRRPASSVRSINQELYTYIYTLKLPFFASYCSPPLPCHISLIQYSFTFFKNSCVILLEASAAHMIYDVFFSLNFIFWKLFDGAIYYFQSDKWGSWDLMMISCG